jgi:5'-3' exonuclease
MSVVHLVDGTFELFRSFYGAPPKTTSRGLEVGATRGVIATLVSLLKEATHVGIAFDTVIESFRNTLYGGYKTGDGIDPNLWAQFPLVEEATRALGLVTWSMVDFECDDALATMAARAANDDGVDQVRICSPDKDLTQMVRGSRVVCVDRMRKTTLDHDGVLAKFGVEPAAIPDLLALVGDDADGIPGLPGFGMKSAAILLRRFGRLEDIPPGPWPNDLKLRGADGLAATFQAQRSDALLYKQLTSLRLDVPLAEDVDALRWRGPNVAALADVASLLQDDGLVARVERAWLEHPCGPSHQGSTST